MNDDNNDIYDEKTHKYISRNKLNNEILEAEPIAEPIAEPVEFVEEFTKPVEEVIAEKMTVSDSDTTYSDSDSDSENVDFEQN